MPSTLITGANRGLGLEFARQYVADGWQVYATCRDPDAASQLRRLADASGRKLRILPLDVTYLATVKAAAKELEGRAIDLLLNGSGNRFFQRDGICSDVGGLQQDFRRRDVGKHCDRQLHHRNHSENDHDDGNHHGNNRPINEEFGHRKED